MEWEEAYYKVDGQTEVLTVRREPGAPGSGPYSPLPSGHPGTLWVTALPLVLRVEGTGWSYG